MTMSKRDASSEYLLWHSCSDKHHNFLSIYCSHVLFVDVFIPVLVPGFKFIPSNNGLRIDMHKYTPQINKTIWKSWCLLFVIYMYDGSVCVYVHYTHIHTNSVCPMHSFGNDISKIVIIWLMCLCTSGFVICRQQAKKKKKQRGK